MQKKKSTKAKKNQKIQKNLKGEKSITNWKKKEKERSQRVTFFETAPKIVFLKEMSQEFVQQVRQKKSDFERPSKEKEKEKKNMKKNQTLNEGRTAPFRRLACSYNFNVNYKRKKRKKTKEKNAKNMYN